MLSVIVAFYFVNRLTAYSEVLIRQFLDGDGKELHRNMGYFGSCCCQTLNKFFLLFGSLVSTKKA